VARRPARRRDGALTASDADNAAKRLHCCTSPTSSKNGYGTFIITGAGVWTYTLDNTNPAVQALNVGGTLTDTFTVATVDGTTQVVTITITGTNDAATISGATAGSVIEAGAPRRVRPLRPVRLPTPTSTTMPTISQPSLRPPRAITATAPSR
jgi:VCBS repeat-containing protein